VSNIGSGKSHALFAYSLYALWRHGRSDSCSSASSSASGYRVVRIDAHDDFRNLSESTFDESDLYFSLESLMRLLTQIDETGIRAVAKDHIPRDYKRLRDSEWVQVFSSMIRAYLTSSAHQRTCIILDQANGIEQAGHRATLKGVLSCHAGGGRDGRVFYAYSANDDVNSAVTKSASKSPFHFPSCLAESDWHVWRNLAPFALCWSDEAIRTSIAGGVKYS
jgi:hypothetical protein